jgi:hypothetical protein
MAATPEALGGEKRLSAVRSFSLTGRTQQVRGGKLVPIEFEIVCELPDRYARKDEIAARESGPKTIGFNGGDLIELPVPDAPPRNPGQEEVARRMRVTGVKQDFVRLTLGMFAASFSSYPLTFSYVGQAATPQGKADTIDARGPDNFVVRLFVDTTSHLPIMVSWIPPAPPMRPGAAMAGAARGAGAPGAERQPGGPSPRQAGGAPPQGGTTATTAPPAAPQGAHAGTAPAAGAPPAARPPAKPVESRIHYADYREVDGLQLPFRLRRGVGDEIVEETIVDRYRINPKVDARRFEVRK